MDLTIINALFSTFLSGILCSPILMERQKKWKLFFLFLISVFFIEILLHKGYYLNSFFHLNFNWFGKLFSLLYALLIIFWLKRNNLGFDFGLTLKQRKGSIKPVLYVVFIISIIEILVVYFFYGSYNSTIENNLFQSTIPGISEEIIYRGFYLGLLNQIFTRRLRIFSAKMGYAAVVTSIMFALSHGIRIDHSLSIVFNYQVMLIPFIFGIVWVWIREKTGSVLIPIIFHNFSNEIGLLIMKFKL